MANPDTTERTSDLYYASYLHAAGCVFIKCERDQQSSTRVHFLLDIEKSGKTLDVLRAGWVNGDACVPARALTEAIGRFKKLVHGVARD